MGSSLMKNILSKIQIVPNKLVHKLSPLCYKHVSQYNKKVLVRADFSWQLQEVV